MIFRHILLLLTLSILPVAGAGVGSVDLPGCQIVATGASPIGVIAGAPVVLVATFEQTGIGCHLDYGCQLMVDNQYVPATCEFPGSCGTSVIVPEVNACHPTITARVDLSPGPHTAVATLYVQNLQFAHGSIAWTFVVR